MDLLNNTLHSSKTGLMQFDWVEYIVFSIMLALSTCIGIFFCCSGGGQHTVSEYYLGNKKMSIFPIAMSLIASCVSGITLLGHPAEVYFYGSQFMLLVVVNIAICVINVTVFLPVFYNLQVTCLYEYLEMRYNHSVRVLCSLLFTIAMILYIPVVIYGPALTLNQVSGISLHVVSPVLCSICIFYTTVGGLKAVVWADALQGAVMLGAVVIVIVAGLVKVGGFRPVFDAVYHSGRLNFFDFDLDPTKRMTFWSIMIGFMMEWLGSSAVSNPAIVQRFIALPSLKLAKRSAVFQCLGMSVISSMSFYLGMIMYALYQGCDPLSSGLVEKKDQMMPFFVLDVAGHLRGLPGVFVAGVVCAALSTMSTGINTLAGTCYEDFIEPCIGKQSERTASNVMKVLSVIIGIICTALVVVIEGMGNIIDLSSKFGGVTAGAILGIFTLGVLVPQANSMGAFFGGLLASLLMTWTMVGRELAVRGGAICTPLKPLSIANCSATNITLIKDECIEVSDEFKMAFPTYGLTVFYYGGVGLFICLILGVLISYATGANNAADINPDYLSPVIRPFLPKYRTKYSQVSTNMK